MAQRHDAEHFGEHAQDILNRWCIVAEQRLDYLTDLYESGRWRRYHSEHALMENLREAKNAVETWRALAHREATPDNRAVDWSWLDQPAVAPVVREEAGQPSIGALGTAAVHAAQVPLPDDAGRVSAELWFAPRWGNSPLELAVPPRGASGADHRWVVADPLCAVSGTVRVTEARASLAREVRFAGRGYHDHRYGSAPPGAGGASPARGRVLYDDRAEAFHVGGPAGEMRVVTADVSAGQDDAHKDGFLPLIVAFSALVFYQVEN